jgi:hypothetical protein
LTIKSFNSTAQLKLSVPPQALLYGHFRLAVLANMKGASQPGDLDFDLQEDAQNIEEKPAKKGLIAPYGNCAEGGRTQGAQK